MAFSRVQGPAAHLSTASTNAVAFAGSVTVGNLVVVGITQIYGGNPPRNITSVQDSAGNSYSPRVSRHNGAGDCNNDQYSSVITTGGTLTVTVTFAGGAADSAVTINEYAAAGAISFDSANSAEGTTSPATPGAVNPAGSTSLYVATYGDTGGGTITPDAAFTQRQEIESTGTCPINTHDLFSSGSQNPSTTLGAPIGNWVYSITSFIEAAAGGGITTPPPPKIISQAVHRAASF